MRGSGLAEILSALIVIAISVFFALLAALFLPFLGAARALWGVRGESQHFAPV